MIIARNEEPSVIMKVIHAEPQRSSRLGTPEVEKNQYVARLRNRYEQNPKRNRRHKIKIRAHRKSRKTDETTPGRSIKQL